MKIIFNGDGIYPDGLDSPSHEPALEDPRQVTPDERRTARP